MKPGMVKELTDAKMGKETLNISKYQGNLLYFTICATIDRCSNFLCVCFVVILVFLIYCVCTCV